MKKQKPNPKANRGILTITYGILIVFIGMLVYMGSFIQLQREEIVNHPYNARLELFSERILRGAIVSSDHTVLAQSVRQEDGTEVRTYPYGERYAHIVGYATQGKTGVEALANYYLLGSHCNLIEKTFREISGVKNPGDTIVTTLEHSLQMVAYDVLGERKGAVVALDAKTGKILAMVSKPSFDPNRVVEDWEALISEENHEAQLLNRATQGTYPPGSVFKIITMLAYMRQYPDSWMDFTYHCNGSYEYKNQTISCYHGNAHGEQTLEQAFANSCNGAFAQIGLELDLEQMKAFTEQLLFQSDLPLSLPYKKSSYVLETGCEDWQILQTAIGQGDTLVTPIHMAMLTAAIANEGVLMKPYVIDHLENTAGDVVKRWKPTSYGSLLEASETEILRNAMRLVVTEGTASALRTDVYEAAGKTGSAEITSGSDSHAWFTGFAPMEDPQIVVTVLVEEGGTGGKAAAPIARSIFDAYFQLATYKE